MTLGHFKIAKLLKQQIYWKLISIQVFRAISLIIVVCKTLQVSYLVNSISFELKIYNYLMGPYLSEPKTQKKFAKGEGKGFSFVSCQMQGWRKTMEDADIHEVDIGDGNSLFAVFDGHGGHQVSKYVEENFKKNLTPLDSYKKKDYQNALQESFRNMDELIKSEKVTIELNQCRNTHISDPISKNTGCTANVVLITPEYFYVANAGDSRSVLCRQGKAIDLSFDHKPQSEEEEKRIKNAGGVVHMGRVNGGLNLTRSFGDFDYKANDKLKYDQQMITCKPDVKKFKRQPQKDEFIIVGCDGIWQKYVDNSQGLIDIVRKYLNNDKLESSKAIQKLLDELIAKDTMSGLGCDNMTCILIRFK